MVSTEIPACLPEVGNYVNGLDRNPCLPAGREPVSVVSTGIEPVSRASETLILSIVLRDQYFKYPFCFWSRPESLPAGRQGTCIQGFGDPYTIHCTTRPIFQIVLLASGIFTYVTQTHFLLVSTGIPACRQAGLPTGGREPVSRASETLILSIVLRDQYFITLSTQPHSN